MKNFRMELCGRVLGLALIHHNFVDAFFTRAFYKFLLGKSYTIEDMASVDREFYSSLLWIRENRITPDLDLYFQVCDEVAGEVKLNIMLIILKYYSGYGERAIAWWKRYSCDRK